MWSNLQVYITLKIPAVLGGRDALGFFEHLGEHPVIPVAGLLRHLRNGQGGGEQLFFCLFHADAGQVGQKIHPDLAFEQLADVLGIQMELLCQHRQAELLRQMLLQIPGDADDGPLLLLLRLCGGGNPALKQGNFQIAFLCLFIFAQLVVPYPASNLPIGDCWQVFTISGCRKTKKCHLRSTQMTLMKTRTLCLFYKTRIL